MGQGRRQNYGLDTMCLYQQRWKEPNVSMQKNLTRFLCYLYVVQRHCFESSYCCSESLDLFTKYKSSGISWHLNNIWTPDPLR